MRAIRSVALCLAILAILFIPGPPPAAQERSPGRSGPPETTSGDYRIGPEDVLTIAVWKNEALGGEMPVRPDGMISLPLLNDVQAAGLTPMELRDVLVKRLSEYMPSPEVSVIIKEVRSPKVSILGEVVHPGRYDLKGRTTVLDLLALAGGLTEFASRSRIVILRGDGPGPARIRFNYGKATQDGARENIELRPGDIVLVL
ncbi:MAG TPA: polysaccharide biosynthesis/export family protein [Candidatus Polarisedimenticolia bacterium]|jgi:polysaccharide export outer membrane protein|nr:polysaccharide biosynthesis/export family protein [Candidatus Polarisedimenticolia bacterium]